jgi:pimeloyl-ACP methyl ester carboxylesterase
MRAHRACRQLAMLLAKKGYHVLRFDYSGTGNSSGDVDSASLPRWIDDAGLAIDELKEMSDVASVSLVGLRLGAAIAALATVGRTDVSRLVAWDPIVAGRDYIATLQREIAAEVPSSYGPVSGNREFPDGTLHYNGFVIPGPLRHGIDALELDRMVPVAAGRVLQQVSYEQPEFSRLRDAWRAHPAFRYQFTPAPHDWNFVDDFGGILLPQPAIQAIVSWLATQETP